MEATFIETRKGDGFKIVVNGTWFYTSKKELFKAINTKKGCKFRTIDDDEEAIEGEAESLSSFSPSRQGNTREVNGKWK